MLPTFEPSLTTVVQRRHAALTFDYPSKPIAPTPVRVGTRATMTRTTGSRGTSHWSGQRLRPLPSRLLAQIIREALLRTPKALPFRGLLPSPPRRTESASSGGLRDEALPRLPARGCAGLGSEGRELSALLEFSLRASWTIRARMGLMYAVPRSRSLRCLLGSLATTPAPWPRSCTASGLHMTV